ncbi:hypothetical protein Taro_020994 [Colocasia esculenta]|uniref:Uncharacterized protein n=1 Tax=Colocasia esculenta TaxID=4460 RepID=A0A843UXS6_COLES|nr:hypothetical protein [Colocasia esculenta]
MCAQVSRYFTQNSGIRTCGSSGRRQYRWTSDSDILSTGRASTSERSCDLERYRNIVNVTVELSSFGRPKKEKLEPHLRPLREATALT